MKLRNSKKVHPHPSPGKIGVKALLVVDQQPIRKKILAKLKSAQNRLIKTKQELIDHLTMVRPAYHSWVASITREKYESLEKLNRQIEERGMLLDRIEQLYFEEDLSSTMAYRLALQEYEEDQLEMDLDDPDDQEPDFIFNQDPEKEAFSEEELFERFIHGFESHRNGGSRSGYYRKETAFERIQKLEKEQKIRTLYRQMARLLHPDTGMESNKPARELWSEVVDAYKAKDLAKLEMLWVSVQLMADPNSSSVGLSDLNQFIDFLLVHTHQINKEKREYAAHDPSWDFQAKDRKELSKIILSGLSKAEMALKRTLKEIEAEIKHFEGFSKKKKAQFD
ncbi:MAG: hypothetical protein HYR67_01925 [Bacteroidetes bacterium]|nr:hypothetical protein [Bacteroidota bacterium]